jgi:hypothetical protein
MEVRSQMRTSFKLSIILHWGNIKHMILKLELISTEKKNPDVLKHPEKVKEK